MTWHDLIIIKVNYNYLSNNMGMRTYVSRGRLNDKAIVNW